LRRLRPTRHVDECGGGVQASPRDGRSGPDTSAAPSKVICLAALWLLLAACGAPVYHAVKKGETLYSISVRYDRDFHDVARWNGLDAPYVLAEGQVLRVAPPLDEAGRRPAARPPATPAAPATAARSTPSENAVRVIPLQPKAVEPTSLDEPSATSLVWQWPSRGPYKPVGGLNGSHKGLDFSGARGEPVLAAADGRVVYGGPGIAYYGNLLIIKHNERFLTAYAHNDRLLVREGEVVRAGQKIAEMGDSGTGATTVRLHFEIRLDGEPVDPLKYLPPRK
jgi:lipoprotein NlpD